MKNKIKNKFLDLFKYKNNKNNKKKNYFILKSNNI
jgi:hypothetical protein